MKLWLKGLVALAVGSSLWGCAAPVSSTPPETAGNGREYVQKLRVDTTYRAAPMGSESPSSFYDLPRGAYVAQGWWYHCCPDYPGCGHGSYYPRRYRSCGMCFKSSCGCRRH